MFYSITSSIPGFVVALDVINFKIVVANRGQTLLKQTETLTLSISGTDITPFTKTFVYILYDCTQTTETTKLINWVIDST
jgi:FlaG/FlaF family flagellin (archaellin)